MITFAELETQKFELLSLLRSWPEATLVYRPAPDAWSATEVLDHIVRVEDRITAAARIGLKSPHSMGLRDRMGFLFIERVFRSQRRVAVPGSASEVLPDPTANLETIVQHWDKARTELAGFLKDLSAEQLRLGIFRHPVSGWMTAPQILRFFSVHMHHHRFQLDRLRLACER